MTITITRRTVRRAGAALGALLLAGLVLVGCDSSSPSKDAQTQGQAQTQQAYAQQSKAVPYPASQLNDSLERKNLAERLLRYNNPSKISYLYLLSNNGTLITYYTIKGKVSSNDSQMTTDQLIETKCHNSSGCNDVTVDAPGDDGSYGPNEPGIFAFTTDGVMVTWNGLYLLTDAPLKIHDAQLPVTYVDGSKPTSTAGVIK